MLISCGPSPVVDQVQVFENGWTMTDTLHFRFEQTDTVGRYNLYFVLNHSTDYPYSNFFMYTQNRLPNNTVNNDTIEAYVAKPDGEWLGKNVLKKVTNKVLFAQNSRFPMAGYYELNWVHGMRDTILEDVISMGLIIEKVKP